MDVSCTHCRSQVIVKNGFRQNEKQNYKCLSCGKQFVEQPENKLITQKDRDKIRKSLLERVSLEGICRIFDVSLPWLLEFMQEVIKELPEDLNALILQDSEELEVIVLEADELHSFVGRKTNDQWLWLVMHRKTRQILSFHIGKRSKESAEALLAKLPLDLKKKPSFTQISLAFTVKSFPLFSIKPVVKDRVRQAIWKDLIAQSDSAVHG
jgi:transposase-like protein